MLPAQHCGNCGQSMTADWHSATCEPVECAEVDATRECPIGTGTGPYSVSRADVAAVCVAALLRPSATNKRVSVYKQRCRTVAQPLPPVPGALETELKRAFESVGL
jgi:hypothetical protein